ncbi:MAG: VOC family protein [Acidimicrobiales bacterium]
MADPLDVLHQTDVPVTPNPAFASDLRRRLADLLDPPPPGGTMTVTEPSIRGGLQLRPYLVVDGADAAIEFYAAVFGARVVGDLIRGGDGRVGHCELDIDGNGLYLADAYPELGIPAPNPAVGVSLHLEVADADATVERAAAAGAQVLQAVEDRFYGSRSGTVRDPFGHQWQIDAPGAAGGTAAEREQGMADDGFHYETVDLGQRAPLTPAQDAPGLGYFTVDVPDGARAAAFYGALLGWDARPGSQPGGFHVENIAPPGGISGGATAPGVTIYLRVDNVAAAAARVRELGGTVLSETTYPSGGNASCLDDQGVPFQLWQPAPGY